MMINIFFIIAVVLILVFAAFSLAENNIKRSLIYLVVSSAGWLVMILLLNRGISSRLGILFIIAQVLGFSGLFLCAGRRGNSFRDAGYVLCALSVIGLPPFLSFWPKLFTVLAAIKIELVWLAAILTLAFLLVLFSLFNLYEKLSLKESKADLISYIIFGLGSLSLVLGLDLKMILNVLGALIR